MSSNIFSRFAPASRGTRSFYEELRAQDDDLDVEERGGLNVDEENLKQHFNDYDIDHAEGLTGDESRHTVDSSAPPPREINRGRDPGRPTNQGLPARAARWLSHEDDGDNDVPASLLVEPHETNGPSKQGPSRGRGKSGAIPGPSTRRNRAQWETAQAQQRLHHEDTFESNRSQPSSLVADIVAGSVKEKALWRWANVTHLDNFMRDVYEYYQGKGMYCILADRALHLLQSVFVAVFLTFLTQCVDYSKLRYSKSLSEITIPQCTRRMSLLWNFGLWLFTFYVIWKSVQFIVDLRRLSYIRAFYVHLLNIPEQDMQTVSWQDIVVRIMALRDVNPKTAQLTPAQRRWIGSQSKERLDAHDIANRLMRKDNYLIAMFNKDVLDLTIPFPFLRGRQLYSRTMEWYLQFSILDFVFNEVGQVNQEFLKANRRGQLSEKLRQRFVFAGIIHCFCLPFIIAYLIILYFFTYYNEYSNDPSSIGARRYTPLAEWKFREFNELPHLFHERLNMSYPYAKRYIDQFPKFITEHFARTVAFMAGALAAVLTVASLLDPELFLGFEISPDRTVLFYTAVFGAIWATAKGQVSEETLVFDPEFAIRNVIDYTHFEPDHWAGRLHSFDVKRDFSDLYKPKLVIFLEELLGIFVSPLILLLSLPRCSDQIIDFFREFTIHVDGLGYVCSFAVFDFKKGVGDTKQQSAAADVREDYYSTKHGKMAMSYYGFLDKYVLNPKTGFPGHLPSGSRQQFVPPPAFPGLNSPTLAADMYGSRMGHSGRARSRAPGGPPQPGRTPRAGATMPQPSPMASMLLDPHHQPSAASFGGRSVHRPRAARGGYPGEIIEESLEDAMDDDTKRHGEESVYEGGGILGESTWETSPAKGLSRENSGATGEPETGVLGLIYQFQQTHRVSRPGGGVGGVI